MPFKPSGGGFGGKSKGGRGNGRRGDQRRDRNRREDREGGRRDFKRKSNKNSRDFEAKGNKRPHRTSNEKKNGFVIRNKGINKVLRNGLKRGRFLLENQKYKG